MEIVDRVLLGAARGRQHHEGGWRWRGFDSPCARQPRLELAAAALAHAAVVGGLGEAEVVVGDAAALARAGVREVGGGGGGGESRPWLQTFLKQATVSSYIYSTHSLSWTVRFGS